MEDLNNQELAQNNNNIAFDDLAHRMANPKLMAIRAQNPFIQILPFPNESVGILLAANVAQDINLPQGTKLVMFSGDCSYYVSRKGAAQIPDGTINTIDSGSIFKPELGMFYYVEEIRQLSIIGPAIGRVTVHCFVQL